MDPAKELRAGLPSAELPLLLPATARDVSLPEPRRSCCASCAVDDTCIRVCHSDFGEMAWKQFQRFSEKCNHGTIAISTVI